jgi:hypothetical protein
MHVLFKFANWSSEDCLFLQTSATSRVPKVPYYIKKLRHTVQGYESLIVAGMQNIVLVS